jgi:hypothetical protein
MGKADRRFVEACPWRQDVIGNEVVVTHGDFERFSLALGAYVLEVLQRRRIRVGLERYEPRTT